MELFLLTVLMFGILIGIAIGIPVMFVLLGVSTGVALVGVLTASFDPALFFAVPSRIFGIFENRLLYSVPLFILMGKLLEHSGLAQSALRILARTNRGAVSPQRLVFSVLVLSILIACSSGIVGATIVMLGTIALPAMLNAGLGKKFSAGLIVASGSLGQLLPPSIVLILLSDQISNAHLSTQREIGNFAPEPVSIAHLFAGAFVPGLLLALCYLVYAGFFASRSSSDGLPAPEPEAAIPQGETWMGIAAILALLSVPAAIISGLATPTEASGFGVLVLTLLFAMCGQTFQQFQTALLESVTLTGVIFGIILGASVFALVVRGFGGDELVSRQLGALSDNPQLALVIVLAIVFVIGFLMEFVEITYVVVPLAAPPLFALGIDPLWFAVLMALNLQISFLTPPMGISLFYYKSVAEISTTALYRAVVPFIIIQLLVLVAILAFPVLATGLPSILV